MGRSSVKPAVQEPPANLDTEEAAAEANGRVAWAGFVLAADIASAEALLAGHPFRDIVSQPRRSPHSANPRMDPT